MPKFLRLAGLFVAVSLCAALATAQDATTIAVGSAHQTEKSGVVSGVRVETRPDGSVWFLIPALDRIAVLQGDQMKQWAIRDDNHLGANPVDFELDGDYVWFICNGESQVDAGHSIFGRLDTRTGQVREWEVPGSRPAGFYRAPDGKVWIPQTDRRIQSVDLTTLDVVDYRSTETIAFSDVVVAPDGALWMSDFGNNRLVRYVPGATTETSWSLFNPAIAILSPSQLQFDAQGRLWISEFTGARIDRFDPASGELVSYIGFLSPIHFQLFGGRVYVTEASGGNGQIAILDPALATVSVSTIAAQSFDVGSLVNGRKAVVHDHTVTPTTFTSAAEAIPPADLKVTSGAPGILRTEVPWVNAYGIDVRGGEVWVGTAGRLAHVVPQTVGTASDLVAPAVSQRAGAADKEVRIDLSLHNDSDTTISGEALYLFSPGFFAARQTFSLAPGGTSVVLDAFGDLGPATTTITGPLRLHVTSGPADKLVAIARSAFAREDGGSYGYSTPVFPQSESLGEGANRTLFTGARENETSIFGFFTPSGAEAVFTLVAPDGRVRGTLPISITANVNQEFQPAASAFGVAEEPGDVIRVAVNSGTILPYVRVVDEGSNDTALSLPVSATAAGIFPSVGNALGLFDTIFLTDLQVSNPSGLRASVTLSYFPLNPLEPRVSQHLTLEPGASRSFEFVLPTVFQVDPGQGAILVESDVPIVSSVRIAARQPEGDFATLAPPIPVDRAVSGDADAFAVQTATRRTNVLLFNHGAEGVVTIVATNGNGDEIGRLSTALGADRSVRLDSILMALGNDEEPNGRIRVEASAGMLLYAWVAQVDGPTGDVEIEALRP
ncbi:MAG TPA: hypothetical protein VIY96_09855 [Thermoanaerobaculia bacterium]